MTIDDNLGMNFVYSTWEKFKVDMTEYPCKIMESISAIFYVMAVARAFRHFFNMKKYDVLLMEERSIFFYIIVHKFFSV